LRALIKSYLTDLSFTALDGHVSATGAFGSEWRIRARSI
jgi:hypothetical protein